MISILSADIVIKFIRFGLVGFSGILVDFGGTFFFKEKLNVKKYISNSIGFTLAATSNYVLNRIWTFESHNPEIGFEYFAFFSVSVVGLGINTAIIHYLHDTKKKNFYTSKVFATAVVMLWNFVANYVFTFKQM